MRLVGLWSYLMLVKKEKFHMLKYVNITQNKKINVKCVNCLQSHDMTHMYNVKAIHSLYFDMRSIKLALWRQRDRHLLFMGRTMTPKGPSPIMILSLLHDRQKKRFASCRLFYLSSPFLILRNIFFIFSEFIWFILNV